MIGTGVCPETIPVTESRIGIAENTMTTGHRGASGMAVGTGMIVQDVDGAEIALDGTGVVTRAPKETVTGVLLGGQAVSGAEIARGPDLVPATEEMEERKLIAVLARRRRHPVAPLQQPRDQTLEQMRELTLDPTPNHSQLIKMLQRTLLAGVILRASMEQARQHRTLLGRHLQQSKKILQCSLLLQQPHLPIQFLDQV
jgi:hypothetical protein